MERRGEEAEPPSYDDTVMEAAAELQEPPPAEAPGSPGSPAEGGPDGARRLPRSHASICFALDQMDQELEAEEVEMEAERAGEAARRTAAAHECTSHPLSFLAQYPRLAIVTTAALPWLTGTAVNPALRAAYLWRRGHAVALVVPWLPPPAQPRLFPDGMVFQTPGEQEAAMMAAIQARVPFPVPSPAAPDPSFQIVFYPGRYDPALGSIMPDGDIQPLIPRPVDCVVLEEPEHLTWYHVGKRWSRAFPRSVPVVGVMHTNYVDYVRRVAGDAVAGTLGRLNRFLCRQHCHKVVKLSDAVQALPRQETCFVHGVSEPFLGVGRAKAAAAAGAAPPPRFARGAYFLGKALYAKGLGELLDRFEEHKAFCAAAGAPQPEVDVFGKGEEEGQAREDAARRGLALRFQGAKDHLSPDMAEYRAFVNPSTSDVVATTSAEALAMGKWLVVPRHPCNDFLSTFPNCLVYAGDVEGDFSRALNRALAEEPAPLSADDAARLSWDAATDRFLHCCASAELGRGAALARVADKTGWVGYNAGYGMFAVVAKAMGSVRKAMAGVAGGHRAAGGGGPGEGGLRGQRTISSHALLSLQEG